MCNTIVVVKVGKCIDVVVLWFKIVVKKFVYSKYDSCVWSILNHGSWDIFLQCSLFVFSNPGSCVLKS